MLNGKKLQFLRIKFGYSQQYIADCVGISKRWVGMIENEGQTPSEEVYRKWIDTLYGKITPPAKKSKNNKKEGNDNERE